MHEDIVFTTYATLRTQECQGKDSRVKQLVAGFQTDKAGWKVGEKV